MVGGQIGSVRTHQKQRPVVTAASVGISVSKPFSEGGPLLRKMMYLFSQRQAIWRGHQQPAATRPAGSECRFETLTVQGAFEIAQVGGQKPASQRLLPGADSKNQERSSLS